MDAELFRELCIDTLYQNGYIEHNGVQYFPITSIESMISFMSQQMTIEHQLAVEDPIELVIKSVNNAFGYIREQNEIAEKKIAEIIAQRSEKGTGEENTDLGAGV